MSIRGSLLLVVALTIGSPLPVVAQAPAPQEGRGAIGGRLGAALPAGDGLDSGLHLAGTLEGNLTPRVSAQGEVGIGWFGMNRGGFRNDPPLFLSVNLVYKWDGGVWRPYASGGLGLYRYSSAISLGPSAAMSRDDLIALGLDPTAGTIEVSDNALGASLGGGLEFFLSRRSTVVGDFRFHRVGNIVAITPFDGSFFSLSVGLKRYF